MESTACDAFIFRIATGVGWPQRSSGVVARMQQQLQGRRRMRRMIEEEEEGIASRWSIRKGWGQNSTHWKSKHTETENAFKKINKLLES